MTKCSVTNTIPISVLIFCGYEIIDYSISNLKIKSKSYFIASW